MTSPLDGLCDLPLMFGTITINPARNDFTPFGYEIIQYTDFFVINSQGGVGTETARFFSAEGSFFAIIFSWCSHVEISLFERIGLVPVRVLPRSRGYYSSSESASASSKSAPSVSVVSSGVFSVASSGISSSSGLAAKTSCNLTVRYFMIRSSIR